MALLPQFQGADDPVLQMMQNRWAAILNPVISNPLNVVTILESVSLVSGANTINHLLQRKMQGWFILDLNAAVTIYRSQPMNDKTLVLTSSGTAVCNIGVF